MNEEQLIKQIASIKDELDKATQTNKDKGEIKMAFQWPKNIPSFNIKNLGDIRIPEFKIPEFKFPKSFRVDNLNEIQIPEPQRFPESIGIKKPAWLPLAYAPLKPIKEVLDDILSAIKVSKVKFPTDEKDAIPVKITNHQPMFPNYNGGGGGGIPKTTIGANQYANTISGLSLPKFDYVSNTINSATETYIFKEGGASGNTVATVVIVYTDSTRVDISTVTKT